MTNKNISDMMRGHADTMILKLLLDGDKYGYQIGKLILEKSNGEYELKEATMYSSVKRLEKDGCITSYWGDQSTGGRRKYFKITDRGIDLYHSNIKEWEQVKKILEILL